jgi:hypothetical protein
MTSYQKRVAEAKELRRQIDILCNKPHTMEALAIRAGYSLSQRVEYNLYYGLDFEKKYDGIINMIKNK